MNSAQIIARLRSVHPATYIATVALVVDVSPADAVRSVKRALFADNAGSVNGIKASKTPQPGRLLPLGSDGKLAASALPAQLRGPLGPAGPSGAAGPPGPSSARIVTPDLVGLSSFVGVTTTVASLSNVAAGAYLAFFTAEADYRSAGVRMYIVCDLRLNGNIIGGTKAIVGDAAGSTGSLNVALVRPIDRMAPFDLTVTCYPDQPAPTGQPAGEIQSQALAVVKLDSVTTS
jgi:hypothetical protein